MKRQILVGCLSVVISMMYADPGVWYMQYKVQCALEKQEYRAALQDINTLLVHEYENPEYNYNAGIALFGMDDYQKAADAFKRAAELTTNTQLRLQAQFNQANSLVYKGSYQEAIELYDAILSNDAHHQGAQKNKQIAEQLLMMQKQQEQEKDQQNFKEKNESDSEKNDTQQNQQTKDQNQGSSGQDSQQQQNQNGSSNEQKEEKQGGQQNQSGNSSNAGASSSEQSDGQSQDSSSPQAQEDQKEQKQREQHTNSGNKSEEKEDGSADVKDQTHDQSMNNKPQNMQQGQEAQQDSLDKNQSQGSAKNEGKPQAMTSGQADQQQGAAQALQELADGFKDKYDVKDWQDERLNEHESFIMKDIQEREARHQKEWMKVHMSKSKGVNHGNKNW